MPEPVSPEGEEYCHSQQDGFCNTHAVYQIKGTWYCGFHAKAVAKREQI